jgi:FixJ family two-component response regulator/signal transduction histidine kinase
LGLWSLDTANGTLTVTPRARALFGATDRAGDECVPYASFCAAIHPDDRSHLDAAFERVRADGSGFALECRIHQADQTTRWIAIIGQQVLESAEGANRDTSSSRIDGVVFDVTERREAEEAAQKQQAEMARVMRVAAMGEMAASIAHEVNQPLAATLANASACLRWLNSEHPDMQEARTAAERIVRDGRHASEVIRRVRSLFQSGSGITRPVHPSVVITEALSLSRAAFIEKGIETRTEIAPNLPLVLGDPVQLRQLLINLIVNAMEAMSEHCPNGSRRLVIAAHSNPGEGQDGNDAAASIYLSVSDTGPGLDANDLTRIFDAFVTSKPDGTGLGLAICRSIAEAHRGRIWAERNAEGSGMTFHVLLPAAPADVQEEERGRQGNEGDRRAVSPKLSLGKLSLDTGPLVLIVDDDDAVCEALSALLRSEAIPSQTFASAEAFLEAGRPDRPACAILDVRMPGRSGLSLFEEMQARGMDLPVLFLTGHGDVPTTVQAMKAGAGAVLTKPFRDEELLQAIQNLREQAQRTWGAHIEMENLQARYARLSAREREVMLLVVTGMLNKQVALQMGITEGTAKVHRGRVMEKMQAASLADLVRMADHLGLHP